MMNTNWKLARRVWALAAALGLALGFGAPGIQSIGALPAQLSLTAGSNAVLNIAPPGHAELDSGETNAVLQENDGGVEICAGEACGTASLVVRLLGIVPVKTVEVSIEPEQRLIPGGKSVGIALDAQGLIVVGTSDLGRNASPARLAGLNPGDVITRINDQPVASANDLTALLREGEPAALTVLRDGAEQVITLTPAADPRDGTARIGAWVRSNTAGVGTLTFVDPTTGDFAALGHAISDVDTGVLLPVADGAIYESDVVDVRRSERGHPGEIVGDFLSDVREIGDVTQNCDFGIFGSGYRADTQELPYPDGLPVGTRALLHTGSAQILTTVDDAIRAYDCEIERLEADADGMRSMVVHVTDPDLIARTGGIVQGMSGSPILQDGRIVGAVTHVFVNDPTRGYGVGIETMLTAMRESEAA